MTMPDILVALQPGLNVLVGGIVALIGAIVQNRLTIGREKTKNLLEKLERAYSLCQAIYDGHLREIYNAKKYWHASRKTSDYLNNRKHPGAEMSELKMLVRCYFPMLLDQLRLMDEGHSGLKEIFIRLDDGALSLGAFSQVRFDQECQEAEKLLKVVGHSASEIKKLLASIAIKSTQ